MSGELHAKVTGHPLVLRAREVTCSQCGAQPNEECRNATGIHLARIAAARSVLGPFQGEA